MNNFVLSYIGHLGNIGLLTYADLPNVNSSTNYSHVINITTDLIKDSLKIGETYQAFFHLNVVLGNK